MSRVTNPFSVPELVLGIRENRRIPAADQMRQRSEVDEILRRLRRQPGVVLADEVGMGKTFVALSVAYSVASTSPRGPVVVMVPENLVEKWEQDLRTFCDLYLADRVVVRRGIVDEKQRRTAGVLRYGIARHSIELLKLLDDSPRDRADLILLAKGAMSRSQTDKWVRLALIADALRRHGRGGAKRLIGVKKVIHRFLAELLWAIGEQRATDWGDELWMRLLATDPIAWKDIYNASVSDPRRCLTDDPVPKAVLRAIQRTDLRPLVEPLQNMPLRSTGGVRRITERLNDVRKGLRTVEEGLWKRILREARWRSPLLVLDEAHHLKNPGTHLARQLQSSDSINDLRTGDGAMAARFDRMLFLTATPFQLGHRELVNVLSRFGDVRWDDSVFGSKDDFRDSLNRLAAALDESQRCAIALRRAWCALQPSDCSADQRWWDQMRSSRVEELNFRQRAVIDAYNEAAGRRGASEALLRPWLIRHNKGSVWPMTRIDRRSRIDGSAIAGGSAHGGLPIASHQLLPFFLAARSVANPQKDLLGEALCSSYEAFRLTRLHRDGKDVEDEPEQIDDLIRSEWYLDEFDRALERCTGADHPKVLATVRRAVDLWELGEKVLIFAFYRETCRALRKHVSDEIERRLALRVEAQLGARISVRRAVDRVQNRFFDDVDGPGRRALDAALEGIITSNYDRLVAIGVTSKEIDTLVNVMRRFLRVETTLVRCFPLAEIDSIGPEDAVSRLLDFEDATGVSWRHMFTDFIRFLVDECSPFERTAYLEAADQTRTGRIRVEADEDEEAGTTTLANVQVVTGQTKRETRGRVMRAFNTPFFPDILVCSEVMGEGVDLQRACRHVIHHDLAWNPSTIEQRTGRIDRLGCKAEGRHSILIYVPYLDGTADERQYKVMSDREQWFRVVMGQDAVDRLITAESQSTIRLPQAAAAELSFRLGV